MACPCCLLTPPPDHRDPLSTLCRPCQRMDPRDRAVMRREFSLRRRRMRRRRTA